MVLTLKNLKERLVAIMKYNSKSKLIIIFSAILVGFIIFGSLYLGAGVGSSKETPPNIYIDAEGEKTKVALTQADSADPTSFQYKLDNVVSATAKEQLVIHTQKFKRDKEYDFTLEEMLVYKDNQLIEFETLEPSVVNSNLYIQAPPGTGEYIYTLRLNFKDKGKVTYGFVVRVDMLTYNLAEISKYRTPYVGDNTKVSHVAGLLPLPHKHFTQQYTSMKTSKKPYALTIYYEPASNIQYTGESPIGTRSDMIETNSKTNALVVFSMIDNLDEVTFAFRISQSEGKLDQSKYNNTFTFQRSYFEEKYGDLSVLGNNLDLLRDVLEKEVGS